MKGFTLIELLAVIVILAIILMIATPMVMGVIDSARHSAARSSAVMFIRQVEQQLAMSEYITGQDLVIGAGPTYTLDVTSVNMSEVPTGDDLTNTNISVNAGVISGTISYQGYTFDVTAGVVETTGTKY